MAELLRPADAPGGDRGAAAGSLYGATDSASSSARADSGGTDLDGEGRDLEAGLADGVGAAAVGAATGLGEGAAAGPKVKKGKKEKKPKKPQMKDDIKTSMASERTFFKVRAAWGGGGGGRRWRGAAGRTRVRAADACACG